MTKKDTILSALHPLSSQGFLPMHMPGHKRNIALAPYLAELRADLDITEIEGSDCLHHPDGIILRSMERGKKLWHTAHSYLLVNGSTCGILAGIHTSTRRGDTVLMARACHKSVYNGVSLCGLEVHYLLQGLCPEGYYHPVTPEAVAEGLRLHPQTKLVILTSPTYEGYLSNLKKIAEICHQQDVILMVDEAHGSHLGFCDHFTGSAVAAGADIIIQSLHKTLPSLTQTAVAHCQGNLVCAKQFGRSVSVFQTTSPSYLLMASIDSCLQLLEEQGELLFRQWQENLEHFYCQAENLKHLLIIQEDIAKKDPSKIIISTKNCNIDGIALKNRLRIHHQIELEMSYGDYALAMTGMGDTAETFTRLLTALQSIDSQLAPANSHPSQYGLHQLPNVVIPMGETHNLPTQLLPPAESVGKICGSYIWAYPPGVPIIASGEEISEGLIALLTQLEASGVELQDTAGAWPEKFATISTDSP